MLIGKNITIGITACTPVDQIPGLIRMLRNEKAEVKVILTPNARDRRRSPMSAAFPPLPLRRASGNPVEIDQFEEPKVWDPDHKTSDQSDLLLIAPASANTIGKAANGIADNLLTTTILSTTAPIVFANNINPMMYGKPSVQRNIRTLKEDGCIFVESEGDRAPNRMPSNDQIFKTIIKALEKMTEV